MTLPELIAKIRKEAPAAAGDLDDRVMRRMLRAGFAIMAREIGTAPDGVHKLAGFGTFRVRTVEAKGQSKGGRRVMFKAASPKKVR
jgi:nucleoid DNA-binding protein